MFVKRSSLKRTFFKQHNLIYQKFGCVDTNALLYLFRVHAMSMYDIESWFFKLHKNVFNKTSVVYQKTIKCVSGCNFYDSKHECLEYAHLLIFKHFLPRKLIRFPQRLFTSESPCLVTHKN